MLYKRRFYIHHTELAINLFFVFTNFQKFKDLGMKKIT